MANPITTLSDLFSKFIVEHGSAVVQEKHIALLKEQFALLEKENTSLKTENKDLKHKIINLDKQIKSYQKSDRKIALSDDEIKVLCFLAEQTSDDISPEIISSSTNMSLQVIQFHLDNLKMKKMIGNRPIAPFDHSTKRYWYLEQQGRKYLIENKRIT